MRFRCWTQQSGKVSVWFCPVTALDPRIADLSSNHSDRIARPGAHDVMRPSSQNSLPSGSVCRRSAVAGMGLALPIRVIGGHLQSMAVCDLLMQRVPLVLDLTQGAFPSR